MMFKRFADPFCFLWSIYRAWGYRGSRRQTGPGQAEAGSREGLGPSRRGSGPDDGANVRPEGNGRLCGTTTALIGSSWGQPRTSEEDTAWSTRPGKIQSILFEPRSVPLLFAYGKTGFLMTWLIYNIYCACKFLQMVQQEFMLHLIYSRYIC